jgi:hypothetical protein
VGIYINPDDCTKEEWLEKNAVRSIKQPEWEALEVDQFPVCLVDNGDFTAAAVGFSSRESDDFNNPRDIRPKKWYIAHLDDLVTVTIGLKEFIESYGLEIKE